MTDSNDDSLDLDRLAAQLRVSQSLALWATLNVGCSAAGLDGMRDTSGLQGMSRRNVGIDVETVIMEEEDTPRLEEGEEPVDMFRPREGTRSSMSKKSRIYLAPIDSEAYKEVCFNLIGSGTAFCTATNCTVAHHDGGAIMTITPGDIFVAKSFTEAFVEPCMSSFNIDEEALQDWADASLSLESWLEKCLMAEAAGNEVPASRTFLPKSSFAVRDFSKEEKDN
jgi:hypothetical protein